MSTPVVPVFLVHFDAPEWCRSAASSILASVGANVALTVIDNGGRPLPGDLGCTVVSAGRNAGYAGGANLALERWAEGFPDAEFALIGSHDLHVEPTCVAALVRALEEDPRLGVVGPVLTAAPRSTGGTWRRWNRRQSFDAEVASAGAPVVRDWLSGTCLMLRRSCRESVGDLDEGFGSYLEDVDFCLRAGDRGWRVAVVPGAQASGLGSSSPRSYRLIAENRLRLLHKREGRAGLLRGVIEAGARVPGLIARGLLGSSPGSAPYRREAAAQIRAVLRLPVLARSWSTDRST